MLLPDRPRFDRPLAGPNTEVASLSLEQLRALCQFIAEVGGIENARRSLEMLGLLRRAS
jgi:hypothetical protein